MADSILTTWIGLGDKVFLSFPRPACQICGKDNHSARTCHFKNTQPSGYLGSSSGYPPLGFPVSNMMPTTSYQCFPMWRPVTSPSAFPMPYPMPYQFSVPYTPMASPTPSQFANSGSRSTSGYGSGYNGMFSTRSGSGTTFPHASALAASYTTGFGTMPEVSNPFASQNWYLDSGANNHIIFFWDSND